VGPVFVGRAPRNARGLTSGQRGEIPALKACHHLTQAVGGQHLDRVTPKVEVPCHFQMPRGVEAHDQAAVCLVRHRLQRVEDEVAGNGGGFWGKTPDRFGEFLLGMVTAESAGGMSERNIAKLREFAGDRISLFIGVADRILIDVKSRSDQRRAVAKRVNPTKPVEKYDLEERRDVMCALAHDILLARAPRSANVIGIRLDWIRWTGKRATIVVPSTSVKMRGERYPDLDLELSVEASRLLQDYLTVVRPFALLPGDEENPFLFPGQGTEQGQPYQNLLSRLVGWVFEITRCATPAASARDLVPRGKQKKSGMKRFFACPGTRLRQ
jgi:hypothetical protein